MGEIVYAEILSDETTLDLTNRNNKEILKTIYSGYAFEASSTAVNDACGKLRIVLNKT